jgi:hypothetical protein
LGYGDVLLYVRGLHYISYGEPIMNVQPNLRMDKAAFLAWRQATEGRYELAGGRVVMMPGDRAFTGGSSESWSKH